MHDVSSQTVEELKALVAVAEHGSFKAAGASLARHATIISRRIAALEERLGVRLVERTTRQLRLTTAGATLAGDIGTALAALGEAQARAALGAQTLRGHLRIALPAAFGRLWIAPSLPAFLRAYPSLHVEVDFSDRYADLLADGYDVAIRIGALPDSTLVARRLIDHRRILCAAPAYLAESGEPERPEQLAAHSCMEFTGFASFPYWNLTNGEAEQKVAVEGCLRSNDTTMLVEAARASLGIVAGGDWLMAQDLAAGRLVRVLPDWTLGDAGGIYLVRPSGRFESAAVAAFAAWIGTLFADGAPWDDARLNSESRRDDAA